MHRVQMITVAALALLLIPGSAAGTGKLTDRLQIAITRGNPDGRYLVWVYFRDKGVDLIPKPAGWENLVTARSLERRRNVLPADRLVDATDLPPAAQYIASLAGLGMEVRNHSKWLNAVSAFGSPAQVRAASELPFVREIELVGRFPRTKEHREVENSVLIPAEPGQPKTDGIHALSYGQSFAQLNLINVPAVHDLGNYAQGVMIGVFDNGFRLPNHEALLSADVLATFDFVDNKVSVVPNNPSTDFGDHGIHTWSTLGGYKFGVLIGPAFGATFVLARTENDSSETPLEEDYWVRAIEWADSLGIQVASTSLGYLSYNAPYTSWTWEDMDGRTTAISRAAAMAVRKGIVVVNSAGNNGDNPTRNTLNAPADADSVLAVGAVDPNGGRSGFSSVGPSTSSPPRIKPDIMAQGSSIFRASSVDPASYGISQGTSFSCPLTAGVAALLLKAHPTATPMQIVTAMKATASNSASPNNKIGWGTVNALSALRYLDTALGLNPGTLPATLALRQNFPNPFNPRTTIEYDVPAAGTVTLRIFDNLGRQVRTLIDRDQQPGTYRLDWDGTDTKGTGVASGVYIYRLEVRKRDGSIARQAKTMILAR